MIGKMNLMFKQNLLVSIGLVVFFILTSEGKYPQMDTVSNKMEGEYEGQVNETFPLLETHVGNIVKRSVGSLKIYQALYTGKSPPGTVIMVYVDSTMTKLVFQAAVERTNPVIGATRPSGIPVHPVLNGTTGTGTVVGTIEVNITTADYGIWKFTKLDNTIWDVSITGESTVDFSYEIIDNSTGAAIKDNPIQEKSYRIAINVPNFAQVKTVDLGMLFPMDTFKPFNMSGLVNSGNGKYEFQDIIKMTNKTFLIGIQGKDNTGHLFRRLSPKTVEPVSLKLLVPPYTGAKLYENKTLDVDFTVVNIVSVEQDIDVVIKDDKGFVLFPQTVSATLKPGENFTGHFTLKGGNYNGEIVTATLTAKQSLGHGQFGPGPSETRQFTVENHHTTTSTATTTKTTQSPVTSSSSKISSLGTFISGSVSAGSAGSTVSSVSAGSSTAAGSSYVAQLAGTGAGAVAGQSTSGLVSGQAPLSSQSAQALHVSSPSATNVPSGTSSVLASAFGNNVQPLASGAPSGTTQPAAVVPGTVATGTGKTANDSTSNSDSEFNKSEVLAAAIVSGIAGGVLVGIGGLVVMGLVFRGAMKRANPNSVTPEHESDRVRNQNFRRKHVHDHDLAWT